MASPDLKMFVQAVKCMGSGENVQQANRWLMQFKTAEAAWGVTVQCLGEAAIPDVAPGEDMDIVHFQAASMLKDKIRKNGDDLQPAVRLQLRQRLIALIRNFHSKGSSKVALQLCVGLANLAVIDHTWNDVIVYCANGLKELEQREMLLDVLKYFPEQLNEHDRNTISITRLKSLQQQLREYSPHVLKLIQHSITVQSLVSNPRSLKAILDCFAKWLRFGAMKAADVMSTPQLIDYCFKALEVKGCFQAASDAIYDFVSALRRRGGQGVAMQIIIPRVLKLGDKFKQLSAAGSDAGHDDVIVNLAEIFGQLASAYVDFMLGPPVDAQLLILKLLLVCTNHRIPKVQRQTYMFWRLLADRLIEHPDEAQKNSHIKRYQQYIQHTCNRALQGLMYPADYATMEPGDQDGVQDFRLLTRDLIYDLRVIIGPVPVVNTCVQALKNPKTQQNICAVEAIFNALCVANGHAGARYAHKEYPDQHMKQMAINRALAERKQIADNWFPPMLGFLQRLFGSNQAHMQHTVFHFIREFADWFGTRGDANQAALGIVVKGIESKDLLAECVPAFLALCKHSSELIACGKNVVSIVNALFARAAQCKQPSHQFDLMSGISMIIEKVQSDQITNVLGPIMQPVAQLLASAVALDVSASAKTKILQALDMISGCFSSLKDLGSEKPAGDPLVRGAAGAAAPAAANPNMSGVQHPANQFFGKLWPTFQLVMAKYADDADVVDKQCRCFKHMLRSAGTNFESCARVFAKQIGDSFTRHPAGPLLYIGGVFAQAMHPVPSTRPLVLGLVCLFIKKVVTLLTSAKLLRKHAEIAEDFFDCLKRIVDHYPADFFKLHGVAAATHLACASLRIRHSEANRSVQLFFKSLLRIHDPGEQRPQEQRQALENFLKQQDGAIPKALIASIMHGIAGGLPSDRIMDRNASLAELLLATVAIFPTCNPSLIKATAQTECSHVPAAYVGAVTVALQTGLPSRQLALAAVQRKKAVQRLKEACCDLHHESKRIQRKK